MDERLSFLLENSNDIFCVLDVEGVVITTNTSFGHFTGYIGSAMKGKNIADLFSPDDKKIHDELFKTITTQKNIAGYLTTIKSKDNAFLDITWSFSFDGDDKLIYATGICTNQNLHSIAHNFSEKMQHVLANLGEGFFMLDKNWRVIAFNPAFGHIVNLPVNELEGADFNMIRSLIIADETFPEFEKAFEDKTPVTVQYFNKYYKGWLRLNIYPYKGEMICFVNDTSHVKTQQLVLALEKKVLELNMLPSYSLSWIADRLLIGIEEIFPEMYCSILEIDAAQERVYHLAAPQLPVEYCKAINGLIIGTKAGSCGTAAYHRKQVIVSDIENDPLWEDYKQLILPHGFKACWSTPVISSQNNAVLATFAIYYTSVREPNAAEFQMIARTVNILRVLIESKKSSERMEEQNKRLQDIASISSHNIRRPVATIMGLVNLFDREKIDNPLNKEILEHLETTTIELDEVIHIIVEKTVNI